jgi:acyl-lipid omega-6 desaturase (Delta-12 desaturase)
VFYIFPRTVVMTILGYMTGKSDFRRKRIGCRIYRHPVILFGLGAALLFFCSSRDFPNEVLATAREKPLLITNLALLLVVALASWTIGVQTYLLIQLPIILSGGSLGLVL